MKTDFLKQIQERLGANSTDMADVVGSSRQKYEYSANKAETIPWETLCRIYRLSKNSELLTEAQFWQLLKKALK